MERLEILVDGQLDSTSDLPDGFPDDDPDDLDIYLWRYCHDHNRRILLRIGSEQLEVELDPDIRIILLNLPKEVRKLEAGNKRSLSFSERGFDLYLTPDGDTIGCSVHRWGAEGGEPSFLCDRMQVIGELWHFLGGIAREALIGNYLTRDQALTFLGDKFPGDI